jgi:hypothetical protein
MFSFFFRLLLIFLFLFFSEIRNIGTLSQIFANHATSLEKRGLAKNNGNISLAKVVFTQWRKSL